jgi:hypothetical protein
MISTQLRISIPNLVSKGRTAGNFFYDGELEAEVIVRAPIVVEAFAHEFGTESRRAIDLGALEVEFVHSTLHMVDADENNGPKLYSYKPTKSEQVFIINKIKKMLENNPTLWG